MELPKELILMYALKPGAALLYRDDDFPEKAHFFVIINLKIIYNKSLFLLSATSQITKRRAFITHNNLPPETLVVVEPDECTFLKQQTAFNCNTVLERSIEVIKEKIDNKKIHKYAEVHDELLEKLRSGVIRSPMISNSIKKQLRE